MVPLIIGLLVFFGVHTLPMQSELRNGLQERFGANAYKMGFSVLSLIGFALIVLGYGKLQVLAGKNPIIWEPPYWTSHVTVFLMIPAMVLLIAAYVPSNIKRLAQHPMLAAVKIWAFAHLLSNGDLASIVLFGSFLAYAVVARISAKRRGLKPDVVAGGRALTGDFIAIGSGVVLWAVFLMYLHSRLIGVAPMASG